MTTDDSEKKFPEFPDKANKAADVVEQYFDRTNNLTVTVAGDYLVNGKHKKLKAGDVVERKKKTISNVVVREYHEAVVKKLEAEIERLKGLGNKKHE